ncbi:CBO0543 family protein [Halalkalibacter okhensis]|uniref:Uncharacterized protein n=1 Tax=Halalkalibacter okhensis TaxID=333138 RepID=A0A0B0IEN6_9BACI|nr:CBO0543 family protein [Halalkalibacter okhensis]KHF38524.1 hypothetical protein LQ50_20875 [Halalkalibacter okhensis]
MKSNKLERLFLRVLLLVTLGILTLLLRKPHTKKWLFIYLFNAITNGIIDKIIGSYNIVVYPTRLLPKLFKIHVLFDFLIYPTISVLYFQVTYKDKAFTVLYKWFYFVLPMLAIELWAEKKTHLIKWKKGWKWYHTLISISLKTLTERFLIGFIMKK